MMCRMATWLQIQSMQVNFQCNQVRGLSCERLSVMVGAAGALAVKLSNKLGLNVFSMAHFHRSGKDMAAPVKELSFYSANSEHNLSGFP